MKVLIIVGALALGGCAQMAQVDANIANADAKLRDQCLLLQGASILAVTLKDNDVTRTIDDAITIYCTSARVENSVTAAFRAAEIYRVVSARLKK